MGPNRAEWAKIASVLEASCRAANWACRARASAGEAEGQNVEETIRTFGQVDGMFETDQQIRDHAREPLGLLC